MNRFATYRRYLEVLAAIQRDHYPGATIHEVDTKAMALAKQGEKAPFLPVTL